MFFRCRIQCPLDSTDSLASGPGDRTGGSETRLSSSWYAGLGHPEGAGGWKKGVPASRGGRKSEFSCGFFVFVFVVAVYLFVLVVLGLKLPICACQAGTHASELNPRPLSVFFRDLLLCEAWREQSVII